MGLDAVELVMAFEDAFDLRIEDDTAVKLTTPRDVIDYVWGKVQHADTSACLTRRAFNLVRAALLRQLPCNRRDITPAARLDELIPKARRQALHQQLATELNTGTLPALERPAWLLALCAVGSLTVGFLVGRVVYQSSASPSGGLAGFAGLAVAVCVQAMVWFATAPLRQHFAPTVATVGDMARWVTAHKTDLAARPAGRWTREQVAAQVRDITIQQLGCADDYREDARFLQDLGAG